MFAKSDKSTSRSMARKKYQKPTLTKTAALSAIAATAPVSAGHVS